MKLLKIVLSIVLLAVCSAGFAQKVKFKKGEVLIDGVASYKINEEPTVISFATLSGTEFVSVVFASYEEPNQAAKMPHTGYIPATLKRYVGTVKFLESGKEMFTDMSQKDIIKSIHNAGLVNAEGKVDGDKLNIFITKYNNENLKYKLVN
jgi:hypothetical protein